MENATRKDWTVPQEWLQFGHGCEPWKTLWSSKFHLLRIRGFNSATAVSRGKLGFDQPSPRATHVLQFGHGCEPWKTVGFSAPRIIVIDASIRPRL